MGVEEQRHQQNVILSAVQDPRAAPAAFERKTFLFIQMNGSEIGTEHFELDPQQLCPAGAIDRLPQEPSSQPLTTIRRQQPHPESADVVHPLERGRCDIAPSNHVLRDHGDDLDAA